MYRLRVAQALAKYYCGAVCRLEDYGNAFLFDDALWDLRPSYWSGWVYCVPVAGGNRLPRL